ncbi:hypothetical protein HBI54_244610 [Parastagonospora nodorum]|nr:hypothetical protein HBI54_244610 [Parastagonospora nodorum]
MAGKMMNVDFSNQVESSYIGPSMAQSRCLCVLQLCRIIMTVLNPIVIPARPRRLLVQTLYRVLDMSFITTLCYLDLPIHLAPQTFSFVIVYVSGWEKTAIASSLTKNWYITFYLQY